MWQSVIDYVPVTAINDLYTVYINSFNSQHRVYISLMVSFKSKENLPGNLHQIYTKVLLARITSFCLNQINHCQEILGSEILIKSCYLSMGKCIAIQKKLSKTCVMLWRKKGKVRLLGRKPTVFNAVVREKGVDSKRLQFGDILQTLNTEVKIKFC